MGMQDDMTKTAKRLEKILWVDYTNHRGERDWRPVSQIYSPEMSLYPPSMSAEAHAAYIARGLEPEVQPTVEVWMVDRDAKRTLALRSIHGFAWQETKPTQDGDQRYRTEADARIKTLERTIERMEETGTMGGEIGTISDRLRAIEQIVGMVPTRHNPLAQPIDGMLAAYWKEMLQLIASTNALKEKTEERLSMLEVMPEIDLAQASQLGAVAYPPASPDFLDQLRKANIARQQEWDDGSKITLSYRGMELAGEVGELLNEVKKFEREQMGIKGSRTSKQKMRQEFGDVLICLDLLSHELGVDLIQAATSAFNNKSVEHGFVTRV